MALHRFNLLPFQFANLERKEKAFIIASLQIVLEREKKEMQKARSMNK